MQFRKDVDYVYMFFNFTTYNFTSIKRNILRIKVFVTHPVNYKCNSAGKVHSITKAGPRATTEFRETERISVYLLAINVHDMESVSV